MTRTVRVAGTDIRLCTQLGRLGDSAFRYISHQTYCLIGLKSKVVKEKP